jgi:large subunit ribosomal protein L9
MKVIFIRDVPNVAKAGEIKQVNDGYGRNYLLRNKIAVLADSSTSTQHAQQQIKIQREAMAKLGELTALSKELDGKEITIKARAGKDKLFGSITSADIAAEIQKSYNLTVDKKKIDLPESIHQLGAYEVIIKLTGELNSKIKVLVIEETEKSA